MFEVDKVYTFNLYPTNLHSRVQSDLKCADSGCNVRIARMLTPIDQEYAAVLPLLPIQNRLNIEDALFYIFETPAGERRVFPRNWIQPESIEVVEWAAFDIRVERASLETLEKVRHAMAAAGIQNYTIIRR